MKRELKSDTVFDWSFLVKSGLKSADHVTLFNLYLLNWIISYLEEWLLVPAVLKLGPIFLKRKGLPCARKTCRAEGSPQEGGDSAILKK